MKRQPGLTLAVLILLGMVNIASADMVQGINIDFVSIGNVGNPADSTGYGAVDYGFSIGKYEVTNAQWDAFVNAAGAPTGNPSNAYDRSATWTGDNIPTNWVSWYEAAQFCNYLTSGDKSLGAYLFSNGDFAGIDRNSAISVYGTAYVIPTEDEWYKAAYYTGSGYSTYANGTDVAPIAGVDTNYYVVIGKPWDVGTGTMEQNGTFDMMGNVWEWDETLIGSNYGGRGGSANSIDLYLSSSYRYAFEQTDEGSLLGFRIAAVTPVPGAALLGVIGLTFSGLLLKRKKMI